jgi:hypothetical protein
MRIDEMHYNFRLLSDKVDSQDRRNFTPWEVDMLLWLATMSVVKSRYDVSKSTARGFETDQKRITDLSNLHIKSPELQEPLVPIYLGEGRYELNLNELGNNINNGGYYRYLFLTKAIAEIKKNGCTKLCEVTLQQIDERRTKYNTPNYTFCQVTANFGKSTYQVTAVPVPTTTLNSPDFNQELEEITTGPDTTTYINDRLSSIYIDASDGKGGREFEVTKLYISYIKFPNRVYIGGYDHIDGFIESSSNRQIHCDLDDSLHDEIVREAVKIAYMSMTDQLGTQISVQQTAQDRQNP